MLWALVVALGALVVTGRLHEMLAVEAKTWRLAAMSAAAISVNWGTYVYGVTSRHVVECALGYFINPLVTVAFGVLIFREQLARAQWAALGLGVVAVLTVDYGRPPVIALVLACSFALYGLVKKVIPLDALPGIAAEGLVSAPFAITVVIVLVVCGRSDFATGPVHAALILATGPVTLVPLPLFAVATQRVPLSTIGLLQYLTPALQLAWASVSRTNPCPPLAWRASPSSGRRWPSSPPMPYIAATVPDALSVVPSQSRWTGPSAGDSHPDNGPPQPAQVRTKPRQRLRRRAMKIAAA